MTVIPIEVRRHNVIQNAFNYQRRILPLLYPFMNRVKIPLIAVSLPDPIASNQYKIDVLVFDFVNMRIAYYHLLFSWSVLLCLELEVSQGSRHSQQAVYSVVLDLTACSLNAAPLFGQIRLMLDAQIFALFVTGDHTSRISQTCDVYGLLSHETDDCRASSQTFDFVLTVLFPLKPEFFLENPIQLFLYLKNFI